MTNLDIAKYILEGWRYKILRARAARDDHSIMIEILEEVYKMTFDIQDFCRTNGIELKDIFENDNSFSFEEKGVTGKWDTEYDGFVKILNRSKEETMRELGGKYCIETPRIFTFVVNAARQD